MAAKSTKPQEDMEFLLEDARIIFRNFGGRETPMNRKGDRNFAVVIPDDKVAQDMQQQGWAVKWLEPREEGDSPTPIISCALGYKNRPPRVVMLTSGSRQMLSEDLVNILDDANILKADLICRAYHWEVGDKSGIKAYVKSLFVTIEEDELDRKYAMHEIGGE